MNDSPTNPYKKDVIANPEAKKAQLEATIDNLKAIAAQTGMPSGGPGGGGEIGSTS